MDFLCVQLLAGISGGDCQNPHSPPAHGIPPGKTLLRDGCAGRRGWPGRPGHHPYSAGRVTETDLAGFVGWRREALLKSVEHFVGGELGVGSIATA